MEQKGARRSLMGIKKIVVERTRKNFIKLCNDADIPRMREEKYPEDVHAIRDLTYMDDGRVEHRFDLYFPSGVSFENMEKKTIILDIHGGGFVYGLKEINMCFNMHVARRTKLPVASVNYTLVPDGSIVNSIHEIVHAIKHIKETYGVEDLFLMGDSAGGFLAYTVWAVLSDKDIRHEYNCFHYPKVNIHGLIMISPGTCDSQNYIKALDEVYFPDDPLNQVPSYARDLTLLTEKCKKAPPKILLTTSDLDSMLQETTYFYEYLSKNNHDVRLFNGTTKEDGNKLYHVFPVGHPDWEESDEPLRMIEELVVQ